MEGQWIPGTDGSERPALRWLRTYLSQPALVSPIGSTNEPRNPFLVWRATAHATSYHLQVAADSAFSSVIVDSTVTDTLVHLNPLAATTKFYWHVNATIASGTSPYSVTVGFTAGDQIVSVRELEGIPKKPELYQNYPNPFNPTTQISYSIPEKGYISLKVHNLLGEEVATLFAGVQQAGNYVATSDGTGLASGVYFCRLQAGDFTQTKKLMIVK